jgi:hypothetical protein
MVAVRKRRLPYLPQEDKTILRHAARAFDYPVESAKEPVEVTGKVTLPRCPGCGWQDVRRSRPKLLDAFLAMFAITPFRCRTCARRFYRLYRTHTRHAVTQS